MTSEDLGMKGEFRLLSKIGEGGMADVFLAERLGDDGFRTRVALKRLHQGLAMDSYFIRQLVREAKLLGQLEHANIVRVFDLRRIGDEYFVVMEFVDGIDLAAAIKVHRQRKTKVPLPFFFHVALSLLEALSYAHAAVDSEENPTPLIHRDIKPSNVMLSRRGVIKLTDFGIAHVGDGSVTGGLVQGTANYMSPEQAYGEEHLTPASDIYSLGAVFFEMLCGRPLVTGDNYLRAIQEVREKQVTSEDLERLGVKPGLRMVVARMLSHDKEARYTDPDMVRNDLQFVADRLGVNLSWHRIRAYVGRLMGILGRAPSRATLSNLESQAETSSLGFSSGAYGAESSLPPVDLEQGERPAVQSSQTSSSDVTSAVRKDLLDLQLSEPGLSDQETQPVASLAEAEGEGTEQETQPVASAAEAEGEGADQETQPVASAAEAEGEGAEQETRSVASAAEAESEASAKGLHDANSEVLSGEGAIEDSSEVAEEVGATGSSMPGDWIEDDVTAVYTGELPGSMASSPASAENFGETTDERTIPYMGDGPPPSSTPPPPDRINVSDRQSGAFPPAPLSMTGEFRPNKPPPKPSAAVAFAPEPSDAGPTGTQVLDVEKEPEDKTWVLNAPGQPAPTPAMAASSPVTNPDPTVVKYAGASAQEAPPAEQVAPTVRKRRKKRRRKKQRSKFFGLDNRTVLLAAIFSVVIGTLLFIILVVLLMRSQSSAEVDVPRDLPLASASDIPGELTALEIVADSGILGQSVTVPPGYLLSPSTCPRPLCEESMT